MIEDKYTFNLTTPQKTFYDNNSRIKSYIGGRGAGKSYLLAIDLMAYVLRNKCIVLVIGPTSNNVRNVNIKLFLDLCPDIAIHNYNKSTSEIDMINGSKILFRSANNIRDIDNLRGLSVHACYIDEVCIMSSYIYDVVLPMIREGQDETQHLNFFSTPRKNWFWEKFKHKSPINSFMLDEISSHSNTYLTVGFKQSLDDEFKGTAYYDQEILAKWVKQSGLIWDVKIIPHEDIPNNGTITYGVDWGYQSPCAILTMREKFGKYYIIDEYYQNHTIDEDVLIELKLKMDTYGKGRVLCDPAQLQSIEFLKRNKINAYPANNKRNEGIRTVRNMFDTGKLFVGDKCLNVIMEGNNWSWSKDDDDDKTEGADHALDTLRYLIMGIKPNSKPNFIIR